MALGHRVGPQDTESVTLCKGGIAVVGDALEGMILLDVSTGADTFDETISNALAIP